MARVKQPYEDERFVAWIARLVKPGEVVEVPDADLPSYLEAGWQPGDKDTKALAEKLRKEAEAAKQAEEQQEQGGQPGTSEEQG